MVQIIDPTLYNNMTMNHLIIIDVGAIKNG